MENISQVDGKVKYHNQLSQFFYCFTFDCDFWSKKLAYDDIGVYPSFFDYAQIQVHCKADIPTRYAIHPKYYEANKIDYNKSFKELEFIRKALTERTLTDDELKAAMRLWINTVGVILFEDLPDRCCFFTSYTKGTERYNKKQSYQAMDWIGNHAAAGWQMFFLTLTCDTKKYKNRYEAWKNYKKSEVMPVLENLRKNHNLEYIGFMESTAKGYPHIHMILCFPPHSFTEWENSRDGTRLFFGKLFRHINGKKFSSQVCLKVLKGENVKYYLTKYLTKANETDYKKLTEKDGSYTKEERKLLLGFVIPRACRIRTMIKCKDRTNSAAEYAKHRGCKPDFNVTGFAKTFVKKAMSTGLTDRGVARLRAALSRLCINSLVKCNKSFNSSKLSKFFNIFGQSPKNVDAKLDISQVKFQKISWSIGCPGCFLTDFTELVCTGDNQRLNKRYYIDKDCNKYYKLSDKYNLNDNMQWFFFIREVLIYFFEAFDNTNLEYKEIFTGNVYIA